MSMRLPHLVLCILLLVAAIPGDAAPQYTIADLGTLGGDTSFASSINDVGQVVGGSETVPNNDGHAFLYTPGDGMTDLGVLTGFWESGALGINSLGQVAGFSRVPWGITHAFLYMPGSGMTDLGTLGGNHSVGYAVNNAGEVVGYSSTGSYYHAFRYSAETALTDLGTLPGCRFSYAMDINDTGAIAGYSSTNQTYPAYPRAFLYTPSAGMADLGSLPGYSEIFAVAVNNLGQVTGYAWTTTGNYRSFIYTPGVGMADLGTPSNGYYDPPGRWDVRASDINDSGMVVGYAIDHYAEPGARVVGFASIPGKGMLRINDLLAYGTTGWLSVQGAAINNAGQIAGSAWRLDCPRPDWHAFLMTPMEEVEIDVKPGDPPNSVNPGSKGVLPVAVLTSPDFDASTIDDTSILLMGIPPIRSRVEDVDGDHDLDMLFHFRTSDLGLAGKVGSVTLTLTGRTKDGLGFQGTDEVLIVGK